MNPHQKEKEISFLLTQVETVFQNLNKLVFCNTVQDLKIEPKLDKNTFFQFKKDSLVLGPKIFTLGPLDFVTAIFHEMVHAVNFKSQIKDVGTNCYHNGYFLSRCLQYGVFVINHKNQGWSIISLEYPRNVTEERFVRVPNLDSFLKVREAFDFLIEKIKWIDVYSCRRSFLTEKKEFTFKYVCSCPAPFNSIRSGRGPNSFNPVEAQCLKCGSLYRCEPG